LVRSWQEILNSVGLEAMARVALPIVFGESFLRQQKRILPTIVRAMVKRNTKESLLAQLEAMNTYPPPAEIAPSVRTPCLVISASDDPLVTEDGAKELAVLCRGHHRHVNGVGHSVPSEAPELFIEAVEAFLGEG
jgi:pimeloyl-ACP methyl ester carboxylesterase